MRILQIIDSLEAGGAERMAINFHNHLNELDQIECFLISTRNKGELLNSVQFSKNYYFLNRTKKGLLISLLDLSKFLKDQKIQIIHVHGTSIYFVGLLKILKRLEKINIIWHDHNGNSPKIRFLQKKILFEILKKVDQVLVVSNYQKKFYDTYLKAAVIQYLPNYSIITKNNNKSKDHKIFNIVLTANLRYPKNHMLALRALKTLVEKGYKIHLTFIGRINEDDYFFNLRHFVSSNELDGYVTFFGEVNNVEEHLHNFDLGILTSIYEGFPVSLIEYGQFALPVVATDVGECKEIIGTAGTIIASNEADELSNALEKYYLDRTLCEKHGEIFRKRVLQKFSRHTVLKELVHIYSNLL